MRVPEFDGWVEADLDALPEDGNRYELIDGSNWRVERHPEGPHLHAYELVDGEYVHVAWVRPGVAGDQPLSGRAGARHLGDLKAPGTVGP